MDCCTACNGFVSSRQIRRMAPQSENTGAPTCVHETESKRAPVFPIPLHFESSIYRGNKLGIRNGAQVYAKGDLRNSVSQFLWHDVEWRQKGPASIYDFLGMICELCSHLDADHWRSLGWQKEEWVRHNPIYLVFSKATAGSEYIQVTEESWPRVLQSVHMFKSMQGNAHIQVRWRHTPRKDEADPAKRVPVPWPAPECFHIPVTVDFSILAAANLNDPDVQYTRDVIHAEDLHDEFSMNLYTLPTLETYQHFEACLAHYCRSMGDEEFVRLGIDPQGYVRLEMLQATTSVTFYEGVDSDQLELDEDNWADFLWRLRSRSYKTLEISQDWTFVAQLRGRPEIVRCQPS